MSDPIFALPRAYYGSYADLYSLIALSGFPTCFIDEIDAASDNTYIITIHNGEIGGGWPGARARIILLDLEWRTGPLAPIPGVREVWTGDAWHARVCGARYVPLGSHKALKPTDNRALDAYDVAFLGYVVPRRQAVLRQLQGVRMTPTSLWGEARDTALQQARVYLHIHQLDHAPGVPPLRMVVAAAYGLPVISETVADRGIFTYSYLMMADYDHLAAFARLWACGEAEQARLRDYGHALHALLCEEMPFRKSVEAAL